VAALMAAILLPGVRAQRARLALALLVVAWPTRAST